MTNQCTVDIAGIIGSVEILNNLSDAGSANAPANMNTVTNSAPATNNAELQTQIGRYENLCQKLEATISQFDSSFNEMLAGQKEQIAKLSVEIARKVIMQKIDEKDYKIEAIIQSALENTPAKTDIIVSLNPMDLTDLQQRQSDETFKASEGVSFVADVNIGPAECIIESPKGIIKSLINSHIEEIQNALNAAI